ncbi:hypothetical protein JHK82_022481 [Glycine max]|nr:hypothetical protein JHK85_022972 [Glycine max]KAG5026580.1 hypothetical protein JHK86_022494 [Glycine max]KAG5137750.1 hypothetical protein JHK82_022481 [Glycine max]
MHHLTNHRNIMELKAWSFMGSASSSTGSSPRATTPNMPFRQIMTVVLDCHTMGVMHRDLKRDNFMFLNKDDNSPLKGTDFGLSVFFKPD